MFLGGRGLSSVCLSIRLVSPSSLATSHSLFCPRVSIKWGVCRPPSSSSFFASLTAKICKLMDRRPKEGRTGGRRTHHTSSSDPVSPLGNYEGRNGAALSISRSSISSYFHIGALHLLQMLAYHPPFLKTPGRVRAPFCLL